MKATILEALSDTVPPFSELIAATASSAVHLEMRDAHTPDDQRFLDWVAVMPLPHPCEPRVVPTCPDPHLPTRHLALAGRVPSREVQ
jgi:hypothetical protein